jgi:hypothetical protein
MPAVEALAEQLRRSGPGSNMTLGSIGRILGA